jgi:hypothetical protein
MTLVSDCYGTDAVDRTDLNESDDELDPESALARLHAACAADADGGDA